MKIMTVALAAATMAVFATTTFTPATAAPRDPRAASKRASPVVGPIKPKMKRRGPRRCVAIYTRICQAGLPCRYVITGHHCNRFN